MSATPKKGAASQSQDTVMRDADDNHPMEDALPLKRGTSGSKRKAEDEGEEAGTPKKRAKTGKPTVSKIWYYPFKSCRGISLEEGTMGDNGLMYDRGWMIVDENNRFISAREKPSLTLVVPELTTIRGRTCFRLHAPAANGQGAVELIVPVDLTDEEKSASSTRIVTVWDDVFAARDCGQEAADFFSRYLGCDARLVTKLDNHTRPLSEHEYLPDQKLYEQDIQPAFSDGYPLLMISEGSLEDLNTKVPDGNVEMRQFRPNIVVSGVSAYEEDSWNHVRIGGKDYFLVKPCSRCVETTVNPNTGIKHPKSEPLRTLMKVRANKEHKSRRAMFGQNVIHAAKGQVIHVGDTIEVIERKEAVHIEPSSAAAASGDVDKAVADAQVSEGPAGGGWCLIQ